LNFSETAEKLFISRPALSKHIITLENELGAELFVRSTHSVYLTDLGKQFLEDCVQILDRYDYALSRIRGVLSKMGEELRIGFLDAASRRILVPSVQRFKKSHPDTKLILTAYEPGELHETIRAGAIDIALTILLNNSVVSAEWEFLELYTDVLAALVPASSPLASRSSIPFAELLDEDLILPNPDYFPDMAELLNKMVADAGHNSRSYAEFTHVKSAFILVESCEAVAIVPRHCDIFTHLDSSFVNLEDKETLLRIGALWKVTNSNPIIPKFLDELRRCIPGK
jgi:DNA-binding transcriptional LysR family regulator